MTTIQQKAQAAALSREEISSLLPIARQAALQAGKAILAIYQSDTFEEKSKPDASPITKADLAAQTIISEHLQVTGIPLLSEEGAQVAFKERKVWQRYWLVDPLDGTKEFIRRNGEFTVNIALMQQNVPVAGVVYAPCLHTLYYGSKATGVYKEEAGGKAVQLKPLPERKNLNSLLQEPQITAVASRSHLNVETKIFIQRFGKVELASLGSSLKFMLLAEGKADLYPRFAPTMEWDTAASHAILNALNRGIYQADLKTELVYNKKELLNPSFICF